MSLSDKECRRCKTINPITDFYKHSGMADGHLNVCQGCVKKRVTKRYYEKIEDPEWLNNERTRGREKYHRLGYKGKYKPEPGKKYETNRKFRESNPEKYKAHIAAQRLDCPEGFHRHHWSYNEEHWKDIITLSVEEHNKLHTYMTYDSEFMMYRTREGELLNSKIKHINYAWSVGVVF